MVLINTKKMLQDARKNSYAVGAFNVNNMEVLQGVVEACRELNSPVILQASSGAVKYAGIKYLLKMAEAAAESTDLPIALHLDHATSFEFCKECIEGGFTSVMIDGSNLDYQKNIEITKKTVEYAHKFDVTVEGELGVLAGVEDKIFGENPIYTNPQQAKEFVALTGVDSLAVAIGTSHGAYKFKNGAKPKLRFDILEQIEKLIPGFPIVLHGASSVDRRVINDINEFGGMLENTVGIPEEMLKKAAQMAVCKVNIDSDLRLAMTAQIRKHLSQNPKNFDPRQYLTPAKNEIKAIVRHKVKNVLMSENKI